MLAAPDSLCRYAESGGAVAARLAAGVLEHLCLAEYRSESADELTLWAELTAPHDNPAVVRYFEKRTGQANVGTAQLHADLLRDARAQSQREHAARDAGPD